MKQPIDTDIPLPSKRFQSVVKAYEIAIAKGDPFDIDWAMVDLATMAWNLSHAIVEGLKVVEKA